MLALWSFNVERAQCRLILCKEACQKDSISTLTISGCGNYTGIGTLAGSVGIFDTHEMRQLYFATVTHSIFVTGLEFLPQISLDTPIGNGKYASGVASDYRTAMVSLSADQSVQLHTVPYPTHNSFTWFLFLLSLFAAFVYTLVRYLISL